MATRRCLVKAEAESYSTEDIINTDLLSLIYSDKEIHEFLCNDTREVLATLQEKEDHLYPPSIQYVVVLKRNALNRTGGNTPPYIRASGIYLRQRSPYSVT